MNHPLATTLIVQPQAQGTLFSGMPLPRQLRSFKNELEEEFLPPRDQRLKARLPH